MKYPTLLGIAFNDVNYIVYRTANVNGKRKIVWRCPFYTKWSGMISRCYNPEMLKRRPSYKDCTVCDEWLYFSKFRAWMIEQDWEDKQLDKDLLYTGNQVYGPDTCIFVDQDVNQFITDRSNDRGQWPIGVSFDKVNNKFRAQCSSPNSGKHKNLGRYETPEEAHLVWLSFKLEQAYILAAKQTDERVAEALINRYKNYTELNVLESVAA